MNLPGTVPPHSEIGLPPEALRAVFPFHFAFDPALQVRQVGPALGKLLPTLTPGAALADFFRLVTPSLPLQFDAIVEQCFTVFFIESMDRRFKLKGQMLPTGSRSDRVMLFLGSPVVRDLSSVSSIGLTLKDFAIHDSVVDFLILLQTKTNTINDVKTMAERLKKEVAERREAQRELQLINAGLEQRVSERTLALEQTNSELQNQIAERSRAEERVRVINARLTVMVSRLEQHNGQMSLLNTMGDMLQACRSVSETYSVITDALSQLLPGESGFLALLEPGGLFRVMASWGDHSLAIGTLFASDDCWGLRRFRIHENTSGSNEALCTHARDLNAKAGIRHVCIPLATQGDPLGLLYLNDVPVGGSDDEPDLENERRWLIHSASEHISLSIANLKLQEYLRQQSICDTLTGLYNRRHMEDSLQHEVARANRSGSPFAVIMLDVDHFKKFNDSYGHQAGDALLAGMGKFLLEHVRGEDIACRYGGEEFILILPGADAHSAAMRAEQIRSGVEISFKVPHETGFLPQVTISLGVASYPQQAASASDAVKAADAALYHSKKNGRNRVSVSDGVLSKPA